MKIMLDYGAYMPTRAHNTDAGADLYTPIDTIVPAMGARVIDTGVHVQIPQGCVGLIKSKSGLNTQYGITAEGVIDEGYTGPIKVKLYNHSRLAHDFKRGDKITQLVVVPCKYVNFEWVDSLDDSERGTDGFGSSGR